MHTRTIRRSAAIIAFATAAVLALAGCATTAPATEASTAVDAGQQVVIEHAWVKATEDGMTAAFGDLVNPGGADITLVAVSSPAATAMELHETVADASGQMAMRERDGGFTIPAGGTLVLEPGGNHLMLMGLTGPIVAGDEVEFTLTFSDGSERTFTAPAKDYSGANERYMGGESGMDGSH